MSCNWVVLLGESLLLLAFCFGHVSSLKCYVCNSIFDPECDLSPPPDKYLVECTPETAKPVDRKLSPKPYLLESTVNDTADPAYNGPPFLSRNDTTFSSNRSRKASGNLWLRGTTTSKKASSDSDPPLTIALKTPDSFTYCGKTHVTIPAQNNLNLTRDKSVRIFRSCGWVPETKMGCKWGSNDKLLNLFCSCTGDSCNSGNSVIHSWTTWFSLLIFPVLAKSILI